MCVCMCVCIFLFFFSPEAIFDPLTNMQVQMLLSKERSEISMFLIDSASKMDGQLYFFVQQLCKCLLPKYIPVRRQSLL